MKGSHALIYYIKRAKNLYIKLKLCQNIFPPCLTLEAYSYNVQNYIMCKISTYLLYFLNKSSKASRSKNASVFSNSFESSESRSTCVLVK